MSSEGPSAAPPPSSPADRASASADKTAVDKSASAVKPASAKKKERTWMPRMWIGMCFGTWFGLLVQNRFRVGPWFIGKSISISLITLFNSFIWALEQLIFGRAIARTEVNPRPLIVLGHWRSGTTWLHELLALDPQFTSPSTYQSLAPADFILTKPWVTKIFYWLLPSRRPMDNMPLRWDGPQEDEFALCNLGVPSPYRTIAFPNNPPVDDEYLTLEKVPPAARERWKRALMNFLRKVTYVSGKRIILKSPPHTARVRTLLEMFPEARFVHIVRDPYVVYPSTVHLWRRLYETHGMQTPTFAGLEECVLETFVRMYRSYDADKALVPPGRLHELRYEDLVADPIGRVRTMYEQLQLGDFEQVRPAIESYLAESRDYKTNRYNLSAEEREQIARRWGDYSRRYGYAEPAAPSPVESMMFGRS